MASYRYPNYSKKNYILRDLLALDRTHLANERTFLAYIRTAITVFIAGISLIKFFDSFELEILGWTFIFFSFAIFARGTLRQEEVSLRLQELISGEKKLIVTFSETVVRAAKQIRDRVEVLILQIRQSA